MGSSGSSMGAAAAAAGEEVVKQANFPSWHEGLFVLLIALVSALASECTYVWLDVGEAMVECIEGAAGHGRTARYTSQSTGQLNRSTHRLTD